LSIGPSASKFCKMKASGKVGTFAQRCNKRVAVGTVGRAIVATRAVRG
jgi:hypothetical protein